MADSKKKPIKAQATSGDNSIDEIKRQVQERVAQEAEQIATPDEGPKITSAFIRECLYKNELGDGLLYAALHRDKFVFVPGDGWYFWNGVHWEADISDRSLAAVDDVVRVYLSDSVKISTEIQTILSSQV